MAHDRIMLLILAPDHERDERFRWKVAGPGRGMRCPGDTAFNDWIDAFVDHGVGFPFDADERLPDVLPTDLARFGCILIDPARRAEFSSGPEAARLADFEVRGGRVVFPEGPAEQSDRYAGAQAIIRDYGLERHQADMLCKLRAVPDERLLGWWRETLAEQARLFLESDAGWAWGDPVGYHYYWPAREASLFFRDPSLMDPSWELIRNGLDESLWKGAIACGKRFAGEYYERVRDPAILARLVRECGAMLEAVRQPGPDEADPRPLYVRKAGFVPNETACNVAENISAMSRLTGDPIYREEALQLVRYTHRCCFDPVSGLWLHHGRPGGPDRELSAPWSRGNGWMLYGIRGLLEELPEGHAGRDELTGMLAQGLDGFARHQGPHGLWHNVMDETEALSRQDSSGTWMVVNVYARAFWKGWLRDERIPAMCEKAWQGLKTKLWRGLPIGHCGGTGPMSRAEYRLRPHCKFLGTAPFLARIEIERMRLAAD